MCIWRHLRPHSQYVVIHSIRSICAVAVLFAWLTGSIVRVANASDNFNNNSNNNLNSQQPCDRTRRVFTEYSGEISNGPAGFNYTQDSHCEWLIKAKNDSQFITLKFHSMGTECSYDYVFVYDGDSFKSPLLGSFSGKTEPQQVVATSGSMLILLYSDTNYVLDGFRAEYFISNCPNDCTKQGKCVGHQCVCKGDWIAKDCSVHACPDSCGAAEGRGICSKEHCRCINGYSGKSCSLHKTNNVGNEWHYLASAYSGLSPRAAHTAIYVHETDSLYIYGGYDLNNVLGALQIYRFAKSTWEDELGISLRSRHFPAEIDNTLLKAVLHQNEEEARHWGLKNDASFFRSILLSISDESFLKRRQRSPSRNRKRPAGTEESFSKQDISEILVELSEKAHIIGPAHRYGHAACEVPVEGGGFVIFGGKLENGSLSNDLWLFNASAVDTDGHWRLRATNSTFQPPKMTRHTITLVEDWLYVFGGGLSNGEFSSRIFRIKLMDNANEEQWEEIHPRGGKSLDVRTVAHTTIYHKPSNSLIIYGGVVVNVARFSKLSDRMFAFQLDQLHWTEIHYPRMALPDTYIPRERAFHTSTIIGNYMIVFGGYTHRHNKEEICYDNQMYLYHLGCHTWVNSDALGVNPVSRYPKNQGVFAHAAAIRNDNTLLIVGGYHGNVNADLLAYTLPPMLQVTKRSDGAYDPGAACSKHKGVAECLPDPECGWCIPDNACYGRTNGANCTTNLQTTRCPGICPALGDCHACLIHSSETDQSDIHSVADKLGLNQCQWCVQNARCHHKDDNYGVCGAGEDTPSQEMGWWGANGIEITSPLQCSSLDRRPGLTYMKYLSPVNWTSPDEVSIVNATMVDFATPITSTMAEHDIHGDIVARLYGFIRPPLKWTQNEESWQMCASYSKAILKLTSGPNADDLMTVANLTTAQAQCMSLDWIGVWRKYHNEQVANETTIPRLMVDFQANRTLYTAGGVTHHNYYHSHSKIGLQHNGTHDTKAFTFEFLEPYWRGECETYTNCAWCLSDALCGWCEETNKCVSRMLNESESCPRATATDSPADFGYLIIQPNKCANCSDFINCEQCVDSGCEWWSDDARCARYGRSPDAVKASENCPAPCHERSANCSACLEEQGRCVWCEATQQCFSFSVYTSEYQFGLCREWLDQTVPLTVAPSLSEQETNAAIIQSRQQCKSCEVHSNCSTCLQQLSCGWCFDRDNPIEGLCMQGDFNSSAHDCDAALHNASRSKITPGETEWAYAQCPDVDECGLGLHDCHKEAKCTNTHGSYNCYCRRGFIGDGRTSCVRTCFESCVYGHCSGAPEYKCVCDLGWTGDSCSVSCGCNNHSTCGSGPGNCDLCHNWTEGEHCERCRAGSYGNATSTQGCLPCDCNGHGNQALGICDIQTGECFCQDNTEGLKCEMCNRNFYGDPTGGGQCYFQCESRGMLKQIGLQGIGSYQSHKHHFGFGPEARECLWIISPQSGGAPLTDNFIQFQIQNDDTFNVTCAENAVYVYDGLPDLIGNNQQSQLLSVFCSEDTKYWMVEARSGHLTVHYKQSVEGQGFNAVYTVRSCAAGTCLSPRICNSNGQCVCEDRFTGADCTIEKCPRNCSHALSQGVCDAMYGRCLCNRDFGGKDCSVRLRYEKSVIITELFNSQIISEALDHLRKTLPRFGHSLVGDKRGNLWMFGGYSLHHQALNDIRQFDTRNSTWMQVTVDSTPEAKMPQGRYFHAADIQIQHSKQNIYVYGGLTGAMRSNETENVLDDFWKFSLVNQRWQEIERDPKSGFRPPRLAGHTLTLVKDNEHDILVMIGGFSPKHGLTHLTYAYNLTTAQWTVVVAKGSAPVGIFGHSAVFHTLSQSVYVFGGYVFGHGGRTEMSSKLYAFNVAQRIWSEMPTFNELNRPAELLPRARFLHSAVTTDNYMVIYGGRTKPQNSSDLLIAYVYKCNQWVRLTDDVELVVGEWPHPTYAQAMTYDAESGAIYVVNGWDGSVISRVIRINLPLDLCELWSSGKYLCRHFSGCSFCSVKQQEHSSHCYSIDRSHICELNKNSDTEVGSNATFIFNNGAPCDAVWIGKRNCSAFDTCESCTALWPFHSETTSACRWCGDTSTNGECLPAYDSNCPSHSWLIDSSDKCPAAICNGDCQTCAERGCHWAHISDDQYVCTHDDTQLTPFERNPFQQCPLRCEAFKNCSSCLTAGDLNDGGFGDCRWSTQLQQCISPSYQSLWCVGGVCGLVLTPDEISYCPEPCSAYTQCWTCLRHAHCGWCSKNNTEGDGVCTEGSLESPPSEFPAASTCDIIYASQKNLTQIDPNDEFVWNYVKCPPENECINSHHNCDTKSERCVDKHVGYECECADGFEATSTKSCIPKCTQGCVRGNCIEPDVCRCDFGYVGANCSIQCQCNGHADCKGPDQLDTCLECHNNTVGAQCEQCKPLYVGDPRNNGECVACIDYCHGHTDICVERAANNSVRGMTRLELMEHLTRGPTDDAICLSCENQTTGDRCEGCAYGHFRGIEDYSLPCRRCQCQGHGDTCDPVTGEKCNCGNNTESDATCTSNKNSAQQCWMVQCSKCRDSYTGNPIDGHQCYKQLTVESKMCFDAKTIDECKKPAPLKSGQTVFFVVQPRFMNVDIRIIVDVTQGELNLYMSPQDDALVVKPNEANGNHNVFLDRKYTWFADYHSELLESINIDPDPKLSTSSMMSDHTFADGINNTFTHSRRHQDITHDCSPMNLNGLFVKDVHAKELSTYITLHKCNTLLRVYSLKNRLVLTLPQNVHNLSSTRFFIALKAVNGPASYGLVFFRQDQLHIDLFVFFSVFFSCFFLFLAVCVVVWKAKQAADVRRARLRQVVEMLHMAKRPFASIQLCVAHTGTPAQARRRALRGHTSKHSGAHAFDIRPIAVEPTVDNLAAVCTVVVRLPGNKSTTSVALASSLVTMNTRQFPAYQRIPYIRRRRISSGPTTSGASNTPTIASPNTRPAAINHQRLHRNPVPDQA